MLSVCAAAVGPAYGASFTFNFNSLALRTIYADYSSDQEISIAAELQAQLQAVCAACTVTATAGTGAVLDRSYTGDNHVVGPTSGGSVLPETLGNTPASATITSNSQYTYNQLNSPGFINQFLSNTNDDGTQVSNEISFQFGGISITGANFNYQVFPNAYAQQPPDFVFQAGNNTNGTDTTIFSQSAVTPSTSGSDGSNIHSPKSGVWRTESTAQYIGSWSGTFAGSAELNFIDSPATIGIGNLNITYVTTSANTGDPQGVPEPSSIVLLLTVVAGVLLLKRRKRARA